MKLKKIGLVLLVAVMCFSLLGCTGGVQRFVGGKDKGRVKIDKLLRQIEDQVAGIKVYDLDDNSKKVGSGKEVSISRLLEELEDEEDIQLMTGNKKVKNTKAKGKAKKHGVKAEEGVSFEDGLQLVVTLKNRKTFTVNLNEDGEILITGSKGEKYWFTGGDNLYDFLSGGVLDEGNKKYLDFSELDDAESLGVVYRNSNGKVSTYSSINQASLLNRVIDSLEAMDLDRVSTDFALNINRPYLKFTFSLENKNKEEVIVQGNYLRFEGRVYTMTNCFTWMESRWNQLWNGWSGDKASLYYLYNADQVKMTYLSEPGTGFSQEYSSKQLPGLKNWVLDTVSDLPLKKLEEAPITTLELKKNFAFDFKVGSETYNLKVAGNYLYYSYGDKKYYYESANACQRLEEAWKEFAPPFYGSDKTKPAYIGRADDVKVGYGTGNNLVPYSRAGLKNWAIHSLLSLTPVKTERFSLSDSIKRFVIDYKTAGEWFKAVVFDGGLILTAGNNNYYYKLDDDEFNSLLKSWNEVLDHPSGDFTVLYRCTNVEMIYRDSQGNKGTYNSRQLPYLTPWAVHSILSLDLDEINYTPNFADQPYYEFEFDNDLTVLAKGNYVKYDGNWYIVEGSDSAFEIIENNWESVLKTN